MVKFKVGRFKAGDRVTVVNGSGRLKNGFTGTVTERIDYEIVRVEIDDEWGMVQYPSDGWFDRRFEPYEDEKLPDVPDIRGFLCS